MADEGGGASRTTDPAAGSSAATDVSLREHVTEKIGALDRHLTSEIAALRRESHAAQETAREAVNLAAEEANERLKAHNGLIEQMRAQADHFATREAIDIHQKINQERLSRIERFQAMLTGGLILLSVIGVANLVKVWTG